MLLFVWNDSHRKEKMSVYHWIVFFSFCFFFATLHLLVMENGTNIKKKKNEKRSSFLIITFIRVIWTHQTVKNMQAMLLNCLFFFNLFLLSFLRLLTNYIRFNVFFFVFCVCLYSIGSRKLMKKKKTLNSHSSSSYMTM